MQPRWVVAAAAAVAVALTLAGCGVAPFAASAAKAPPAPTVTAVGYALVAAPAPGGAVAIHVNLLIGGNGAKSAWRTLGQAVAAVEAALRSAGAPARGLGVAGAASLTAQVGPGAVEATQTVVATLPSMRAALEVLGRLQTAGLAGYDGYYLSAVAVPAPSVPAERAADGRALAQARRRAADLAAAAGRRLGALRTSRTDLLAASPCAPVSGCVSATGDLVPSPGAGQVVVAVQATYATRAG